MVPVIARTLASSYDDAIAALPAALAAEGFGVLTEIDLRETLKAKLGVDFRRYKIFGACNPPLAHRALSSVLDIGVMLPCNVVIYEDGDHAVVRAIDPTQTIAAQEPALVELAEEVRQRLGRAIDRLR